MSADDPRFSITLNYEILDDLYCLFQVDCTIPSFFVKLLSPLNHYCFLNFFQQSDIEDDRSTVVDIDDDDDNTYSNQGQVPWADGEIFDDNYQLVPDARPYTSDKEVIKMNHPLMIMAEQGRTVRTSKLLVV